MTEIREERKRERAQAREGRRAGAGKQNEESGRDSKPVDVKRAVATAASAAVAGAIAGAAKALIDKRGVAPKPEADAERDEPEAAAEADSPQAEHDDESEEGAAPEQDDTQQEDDDSEDARPQHDEGQEEQEEQPREQTQGASSGKVASMIGRAKEHVEQVLGSEPESVSGVERSNGNWCVNVEVVQLHRVPESTDVMSSFAVVVDDDGDLISLHETRRYRRSQAGDER